jgi:hypothetical protein
MPKKKKGALSNFDMASVDSEFNLTLFGQTRSGKSRKLADLIIEHFTKEGIDAENAR